MTLNTNIIERLLLGEKNAFKEVYNEYYSMLYHLCLEYIRNKEDAKGIVQNSYLKLWEIKKELNKDSNIKNFLFTITKNGCLNYLKRKQIIAGHNSDLIYLEMQFNYNALHKTGDKYMEFNELKQKTEDAIKKLPEQCCTIFNLSRFEEKKNREIAEELGISLKAVEAQITKALKFLRKELKDYMPILLLISKLF